MTTPVLADDDVCEVPVIPTTLELPSAELPVAPPDVPREVALPLPEE